MTQQHHYFPRWKNTLRVKRPQDQKSENCKSFFPLEVIGGCFSTMELKVL